MLKLIEHKMYWDDICLINMVSIIESNNIITITKPDNSIINIDINTLRYDELKILRSYVQQYIENPSSFNIL